MSGKNGVSVLRPKLSGNIEVCPMGSGIERYTTLGTSWIFAGLLLEKTQRNTLGNKMEIVTLTRHDHGDQGTFGVLVAKGKKFFTGELPWRNNESNFSCIPVGSYYARWTWSARFKRKMYEITPVGKRAGIRAHSANLMGDTRKGFKSQLNGCIAPGEKLGYIDGQKAVLLSAPAIRTLEALMEYKTFRLEITDGTVN